jgi:hypothetical protein
VFSQPHTWGKQMAARTVESLSATGYIIHYTRDGKWTNALNSLTDSLRDHPK